MGTVCALAQILHTTDALSDYNRGNTMYQNGNYAGCWDIMQSLLRRDDAASLHEEAAFLAAMSQAHRGVENTPDILNQYLYDYPYTHHRNEIYLALGEHYYYTGRYDKALELLLRLDVDNIKQDKQDMYNFHKAFCYVQTEQYEAALPLFKNLSQNSSRYRNEARYYEGYIYYISNDFKNARRTLSLVQSSSTYSYESLYLLVNINYIENNYAQAIALSEQLINNCTNPTHLTELNRIAGECHFQLGNDKKAEEYLTEYLNSTSAPTRNALYIAGIIAFRNNKYDDAIELLSRTTATDDAMSQNAYLHLGLAHLQQNNKSKAAQAFEQAAQATHDDHIREVALYNQAMCAYENEISLFDSTITLFEKFLAEYPDSQYIDEINARLSDLYISSRDYRSALNFIDRINNPSREILRQRQQILYTLGTETYVNKNYDEASEWFTQAATLGNYSPEHRTRSFYWLGECCYRKGFHNEALKYYTQFLNADVTIEQESRNQAQYDIAYCYFTMQKYDNALTEFDKFVKLEKDNTTLIIDAYNRLGDCYFLKSNFTTAERYYAKAATSKGSGSDYALLQQAITLGATKNYTKKATLLKELVAQYPQSEYIEEALNELGQTYITMNRPTEAIDTYRQILQKFPHSTSARKATLQLASLYYNKNDIPNAIIAYQTLITEHPASSEAKMAINDYKSICVEHNRIEELTAFMHKQGINYESYELDSLNYMAAQHKYTDTGAIDGLENYLTQFPQGVYIDKAFFYLGNVADAEQNEEKALLCYKSLLDANPDSEFAEDALLRCGDINYNKEQYTEAAQYYDRLETVASSGEIRQLARLSAMRCYNKTNEYNNAIGCADRLLTNENLQPELRLETIYSRASAHLALGDSATAYEDFVALSTDTRNIYGAEAAMRVVEYLYHNNRIDEAEEKAFEFIEKGSPHAYWVARLFILIADIYTYREEYDIAIQYLESLKENYPGSNDDINTLIEQRLNTLQNQ